MLFQKKKIIFSLFLFCFTKIVLAQITVNDNLDATELVNILTSKSPCVNVSGEIINGNTSIGNRSYGSFDKSTSSFPFGNGIVLSSWRAKNSVGPFVKNGGSPPEWSGDIDLENALGIKTVNATSLEFDFIPKTNSINFNYIFASNEYQLYYPCNYSDGFAFLIKEKGSTSPYVNLAVIPGTTTPVSSKTIHPVIDTPDLLQGYIYKCPASNENYYDSSNISTGNNSPINYAGQTVVMNAQSTVTPGKTYHIKLVVADNGNYYFNSAVFLEGGSFAPNLDLGSDRLKATNNPICFGESLTLDASINGATYNWYKDVSSTSLSTDPTYTVDDVGTYRVEATVSGCTVTDQIKIEYADKINLNIAPLEICAEIGASNTIFDLTKAQTDLIKNNTDIKTIEYFENQTSAGLLSEIKNPNAYNGTTGQIIFAKLTNKYGCSAEAAAITLQTTGSTLSSTPMTPPVIHDFSGQENFITLIPPATGGPFEFSLDGINYQKSPLFTNLIIGEYTAYIRDTSICEYWTYPLALLDYPHFFTPNGDGYNDVWEVKNLANYYPKANISIFNRYGKLLKQLDAYSTWDGKYIGNELPADDYWFKINLTNDRIIKGHFSLKR